MAASFYTQPEGPALQSLHWELTRSDTVNIACARLSPDNGRSWAASEAISTHEERPDGVFRRFPMPGFVDPASGRLLMLRLEAVFASDTPKLDGPKSWCLHYTLTERNGTLVSEGQAMQDGEEFDAAHPFPGHWVGRNAIMMGAISNAPLSLPDGSILIPCQITPLGEDGEYANLGGGYTYSEILPLRLSWKEDGSPRWEALSPIKGDPGLSTRGLIEPVLGLLEDGRILLVMRGSNDVKPELPGYKWCAISSDGGNSWSEVAPWTYDDGTPFFSPSSCPQLVARSSGELLWFGNISESNPVGNAPRYPLVMGRVDRKSGLLVRDSVTSIDTRGEEDAAALQLSNFYAREDRETGDIVVHCARLFAGQREGEPLDWTADALLYRVTPEWTDPKKPSPSAVEPATRVS